MIVLNNPNLYHGNNKKYNFFEGWYFKLTTNDNSRCIAFIIGISLPKNIKQSHSFIQVLDGNNRSHNYIKYSKEDFKAFKNPFKIQISKNSFSFNGISLNIAEEKINVKSTIVIKNIKEWNDSLLNPGSMGFYNYISFMQCYSQVCALNGDLSGTLLINGEKINFNNGKIYIEKNWGSSFPLEWIWVQCNNFENSKVTLTCSLGRVPFLFKSFQGFLIGVTIGNKLYKFTTINNSKINLLFDSGIHITAINKNIKLTFNTINEENEFILCYGPKNGSMSPYVKESLISKVHMKLEDIRTSKIIYEGFGVNTGIEYGGNFLNKRNLSNR